MNSKTSNFSFTIIAIILGVVIYKQFDFDTFKFKNTALAIIYIVAFLFSIYILLKNKKKTK
jgi:predicted ferric reductase